MMGINAADVRYSQLYALQDAALDIIFSQPVDMYLTGGTALSRWYFGHRYSDDLDLFTHEVLLFGSIFREVRTRLAGCWTDIEMEVDSRDYKRIRLRDDTQSLKIDFVADRMPRVGLPAKSGGILVDTVRNILANKIVAIMGRDEPRDVVDLVEISRHRHFEWPVAVEDARLKVGLETEDLLYRLGTFPADTVVTVPLRTIDPGDHDSRKVVEGYSADLARIITDIEAGVANSLAVSGSEAL